MPLSPMDEYLAHQTCETFDHVFTSDRNFYDRHYFNLHPDGDDLFVVIGMGQYPNLGTTDAFVAVSKGEHMHVLRSSRELGSNRMETKVGPIGVEVLEGLRKLRVFAEPNEWGIECDLVFDALIPAVEEPRTVQRQPHGRITTDTSRYSQTGRWTGTLTVDGDTIDVRPETFRGVRDHSWGVRGVGEPEPPGIRIKSVMEGFGFFHTWIPLQLENYQLKLFKEEDQYGNPIVEESVRVGTFESGGKVEQMGSPRFDYRYQSGTREIESATIEVEDPDGKLLTIEATPVRTVYLAAGTGYVPNPEWAHGMYQGPLKVEGVKTFFGSKEARASLGPIYETLCRFELSDGQSGYGMLENLVVGVYEPFGFKAPGDMAP